MASRVIKKRNFVKTNFVLVLPVSWLSPYMADPASGYECVYEWLECEAIVVKRFGVVIPMRKRYINCSPFTIYHLVHLK